MALKFQNIHVIINPSAGGDEPMLNIINDVFAPHEANWSVSVTTTHVDGTTLARKAIESGADLIAAYGGDGTMREVASAMIGHDVPLAILPGGTGNALGTELGIPMTLREAVEIIFNEQTTLRAIDAGQIGEDYFLLRADFGLSVEALGEASRDMKDRFGNFAYVYSAFKNFADLNSTTYHLTIDGQAIEAQGVFCLVVNAGGIGGGTPLSINKNIVCDDGLMDVMVVEKNWGSALTMAASILDIGDAEQNLQHWQGKEISVQTEPSQGIGLDGDEYGQSPANIRIIPAALKVLALPKEG
jgi:diacylglycerol kinase (ATP)